MMSAYGEVMDVGRGYAWRCHQTQSKTNQDIFPTPARFTKKAAMALTSKAATVSS